MCCSVIPFPISFTRTFMYFPLVLPLPLLPFIIPVIIPFLNLSLITHLKNLSSCSHCSNEFPLFSHHFQNFFHWLFLLFTRYPRPFLITIASNVLTVSGYLMQLFNSLCSPFLPLVNVETVSMVLFSDFFKIYFSLFD